MVSVNLSRLDSIAADGFGNDIALRLRSAGQHDIGKHLWNVCAFMSNNRTDATCSNDQYSGHDESTPCSYYGTFTQVQPLTP